MVAFTLSLIVSAVLLAVIVGYMQRRPVDAYLSWGEAMFASMFVFFVLFWVYGVVPHQWLVWADNELNWRSDKLFVGPAGILEAQEQGGQFPFTITYVVIRDVIAVSIYGVALVLNIALFSMWQNRGKRKIGKTSKVDISTFGRPLIRGDAEVVREGAQT